MKKLWLVGFVGGAFLVGCGGGGTPFADLGEESNFGEEIGGQQEQAVATSIVAQPQQLEVLTEDGATVDDSSLGVFTGAVNGPTSLLAPLIPSEAPLLQTAREQHAFFLERFATGQIATPTAFQDPTCVEAGAGFVQFNNCIAISDGLEASADGRIEVAAGRFLADVTVQITGDLQGTQLVTTATYSADLGISTSGVDGRWDASLRLTASGLGNVSYATAAVYDVQVENFCPNSGDVRVGVKANANAQGQSFSFEGIARATFTGCENGIPGVIVEGRTL